MLEAPNFQTIKNHIQAYPNAICCIVIAPYFHKIGFTSIIQRFGYLDHRSSEDIHFYCAGYGGYWNKDIFPDMEEIGITKYQAGASIPWSFSQSLFAKFVDELEKETNWKYSSGTEIILLDSSVDFSNCIIFNLDEMIEDKIIHNPSKLFEALIQYARMHNDIEEISSKEFRKVIGYESINSIFTILPKPFQNLQNAWKKGKHYILKDIKK